MLLPPGIASVLALFAGAIAGVRIEELASRYARSEQPASTIRQLAKRSPSRAWAARLFLALLVIVWLGGGGIAAVTYLKLIPHRMEVAALFVFIALPCFIGLLRGLFEVLFGVGTVPEDPAWPLNRFRYLTDVPGIRLRGALRLSICSATLAILLALSVAVLPIDHWS